MQDMKLSPETWKRLEPLLTEGLELARAEREAWLEAVRRRHPDLVLVLDRMLRTHDEAERAGELETVPKLAAAPSAFTEGELVGPFRLLHRLGRGGMGEVWLAAQVDGRLEREVALKLPTSLEAGDIRAERFRRERDILAKLVHPNIARLYDAGASAAGQPYLALEYVEGVALDAYVADKGLAIPERLALFRQVLAAVAHAHRHLVVHRDLKPANILIDREGQVKLLDFGIARLTEAGDDPARRDLTRIGGRVLTMRYAAPEQVGEGAITTATDVYALGIVLYELLTGASPYRAVREGRALTDSMLMSEDIATPSALAKGLSGDLDAILLKALRRDPAQRYATVEAFDNDIGRHLEHRPVAARAGTWRYLAGRFVTRHRVPLGVAAGTVVLLVASLAAIEAERRQAVAERQRAERHLASVRRLANSLIFDVHAQIEDVPGTLRAREKLVSTSLAYLDGLAAEAGDDRALVLEIAGAYRKIAAIQGGWGGANKGELDAAVANYEKARTLLEKFADGGAADLPLLRERAGIERDLARAYFKKSDRRWEAGIDAALRLAKSTAAHRGASFQDQVLVHVATSMRAAFRNYALGQSPELEADVAGAVEGLEAIAREHPSEAGVRADLINAYSNAAAIHAGDRHTPEGLERAIAWRRKADALARELVAAEPGNYRYRKMEPENTFELARLLSMANKHREAGQVVDAAIARAEERRSRESDPDNIQSVIDHLYVLARAAQVASAAGDHEKSIRRSREALALVAAMPGEVRTSREVRHQAADARIFLGWSLLESAEKGGHPRAQRLARLREACGHLDAGAAWVEEARAGNLASFSETNLRWLEDHRRQCKAAMRRLGAATG